MLLIGVSNIKKDLNQTIGASLDDKKPDDSKHILLD
jgi:hypothetical protein